MEVSSVETGSGIGFARHGRPFHVADRALCSSTESLASGVAPRRRLRALGDRRGRDRAPRTRLRRASRRSIRRGDRGAPIGDRFAPGLSGTDPQWLAEVARVVPELKQRFAGLPEIVPASTADIWRLFEGIAQMLLAISEETPLTVLIDDVQWCDADSCALLHFLVRKLERAAILWFVTFAPGAVERDSAAARWVRALRGSPACEVIALQPLSEDEVRQLVRGLGRVGASTDIRAVGVANS